LIITLALPNLDQLSRNNRRELARYGPKRILKQFGIVQIMDRPAGMLVFVHPGLRDKDWYSRLQPLTPDPDDQIFKLRQLD